MVRKVPLVIYVGKNHRVVIGDVEIGDTGLLTAQISTNLYMEDGDNTVEIEPAAQYVPVNKLGER